MTNLVTHYAWVRASPAPELAPASPRDAFTANAKLPPDQLTTFLLVTLNRGDFRRSEVAGNNSGV
jgi:hypothetical protein